VWRTLFLPQLDSFDMMPSRSRKADTRGVRYARIIPQNSNFIYNKFIKIYVVASGAIAPRSNLLANEEIAHLYLHQVQVSSGKAPSSQ
jgi:hypothetical protein